MVLGIELGKGIRVMMAAGDSVERASKKLSPLAHKMSTDQEISERDILFSCFRNNSRPAVFITPDRSILFANDAGESLVTEGAYFQSNAGRIQPTHSSDRETFLEALKQAFDGRTRGVGLIRNAKNPEQFGAFSISANEEGSAAAVTFLPPWTVGAQRAAVMFEPYDLTPAEQHIAECLISGFSLSDIAELNDISLSTVKSHVKRIYQKTRVEKRIEFMTQFMLLVAIWL